VPTAEVQLCVGQYTREEVAKYARVSTTLVDRWCFKGEESKARSSAQRFLTFLDLVEAVMIRVILLHQKVALEAIRTAARLGSEAFGVERPLAKRHRILLSEDKIVIVPHTLDGWPLHPPRPDALTIDYHQRQFRFDAHGNPVLYYPMGWFIPFEPTLDNPLSPPTAIIRRGVPTAVMMNPRVHLGEPIVLPSGYSAQTLWEALKTEGSVKDVAEAYGVHHEEVTLAFDFYNHLQGAVTR
jgi:uncharacterized protein (DUF433 family)